MAWHTEYGQALHQSAHLTAVAGLHASLDATRDVLLAGDPVGLLEAFPDGVRIDDQRVGRVEGRAALEDYCRSSSAWMAERQAQRSTDRVDCGRQPGRRRVRARARRGRSRVRAAGRRRRRAGPDRPERVGPRLPQPVAAARPPCRPLAAAREDPAVRESDVVGDYQRALAAGDAEAIVRTFEPDGCFREPAGDAFRVCGTDALAPFFARFFSAGGGIILEHCTVTEDGTRTALEFNAVRWGGVDLPPQAGVAVYERGATGRIAAARIYDDVEGPVE